MTSESPDAKFIRPDGYRRCRTCKFYRHCDNEAQGRTKAALKLRGMMQTGGCLAHIPKEDVENDRKTT